MIVGLLILILGILSVGYGAFVLYVNDTSRWSTMRVVAVFWLNVLVAPILLPIAILIGITKGISRIIWR